MLEQKLKNGGLRFQQEFEKLNDNSPQLPQPPQPLAASEIDNRYKNRWVNIAPCKIIENFHQNQKLVKNIFSRF